MAAIDELLKEMSEDGKDVLLLIRELSGLVSYYRRLLEKFELDTLTGLPGSNKYIEFKAELKEHPAASVGVIVFDVNDLKYYNDNKGHQAGDLLLQKAAESFHRICDLTACRNLCRRATDRTDRDSGCENIRVFRTGGDEFVAFVTNCTESSLNDIIAQWREKLVELNAANDGICCSVAHGAAFGENNYDLDAVLLLADERMYAEKRRMKENGEKMGDVR